MDTVSQREKKKGRLAVIPPPVLACDSEQPAPPRAIKKFMRIIMNIKTCSLKAIN